MSEAKSGGAVSTYTIIGTVDANGKAQAVSASLPVPVGSATAGSASAPATAAVTSTSAEAVATNSSRTGISIVNVGASDVFLGLGAAAEDNKGICLKANGGSWDGLISGRLWTGQVRAKTASGTSTLAVQEIT